MPRAPRSNVEGGIHHVTTRGHNRTEIFVTNDDREWFLDRVREASERTGVLILSYVLMPNHFHLLVEVPDANLPEAMQLINGGYADRWRGLYGGHGSVFDRRYYAGLVNREPHLRAAYRYIALNPVASRLCAKPEDWEWSAHAALAGLAKPHLMLAVERTLRWFHDTDDARARDRYRWMCDIADYERPAISPVEHLIPPARLGVDQICGSLSLGPRGSSGRSSSTR